MPYCPRCGVEIENSVIACPLCKTKIPALEIDEKTDNGPVLLETKKQGYIQSVNFRQVAWETTGIVMAFAIGICIAIDLLITGSLSWSKMVISSIFAFWTLLTIILYLGNKPILLAVLSGLTILGFLFALDFFDLKIDWFGTLGLPITFFSMATGVAVYWLSIKSKKRGLNVVAYFLFAVVINCSGIEGAVNYFLFGKIYLSWSFIVFMSVIPEAVLFLYLHYRLLRHREIKRYFHF